MRFRKFFRQQGIQENNVEKATFRNMMLITYCITIAAACATILIQFDALNLTTWARLDENRFSFGCVEGVSWELYIVATVCQSLVPTTLTFAGSVLILQSLSEQKSTGKKSSLFVAIVALAIFGVVQNAVKTQLFLILSSLGSIILSGLTLYLSKANFSLQIEDSPCNRKRKCEATDCQPCA